MFLPFHAFFEQNTTLRVVHCIYSANHGNLKGMDVIKRQQIAAARVLVGWSRAQLAERAGVSLRTLARFESGEGDITAAKLEFLEEALLAEGIEFIDGGATLERLKRKKTPVL